MIRAGIRRAFQLALRRRDHWQREVEDEIKLHLTLRAEQLMARGASANDAYNEAVRKFGPLDESRARLLDAARHRERQMQRTEYLADLRNDLTFALRTLRRDRGWTTVTILTLALGVGAATAVFSAVSSLLLHAVSYPGASRVMIVFQQPARGNNTGINVTITPAAPVIRAWKASAHSFEDLEAYATVQMAMRTTGDPVDLQGTRVEPTFAAFAGVRPLFGRLFTPAEIESGGRQVLLGEGLWRTRFGADSAIIGRAITLDDSLYSVIGVMPATLRAPRAGAQLTDIWLPLSLKDDRSGASVVGRLRPGVDALRAQAELDSVYARLSTTRGPANFHTLVVSPQSQLNFHDSLILLGYAVALVLLVACANVAHLLLARSTSRRRELAIRAALGAGRSRVFRQLLTESLLLATTGGALGVLIGWLGLRAIVAARPTGLPALALARVDLTTLGAALAVTITTSIVFGLLGAMHSARESTHDALKSGSQRSATGGGHMRQFLVVTEMALSATLVVGATMLVRSVINLQRADLGFEPSGLYTIRPNATRGHFPAASARGDYLRTLSTRIATIPGVQSVSMASAPPGWFSFTIGRLEIEGRPAPATSATEFIHVNKIQTGYFTTMHQRVVNGTAFTDTTGASNQVMVNEGFARKQWHGESPIGKRLRVAQTGKEPWMTIVGVAAEAGGPTTAESTAPLLYTPAADSDAAALVVRITGSGDLLQPVRPLAHSIDPNVVAKIQSVEASISDMIAEPRFVMILLTMFTALALALAAIGLYGVMAYSVSQRTREIGIRLALGATRGRIARPIVAGGVWLALIGCAFGAAVSIWGTKVIESQLYGVAKHDATSMLAAFIVLVGAALVACVIPARRALAVDPMTAIRAD